MEWILQKTGLPFSDVQSKQKKPNNLTAKNNNQLQSCSYSTAKDLLDFTKIETQEVVKCEWKL